MAILRLILILMIVPVGLIAQVKADKKAKKPQDNFGKLSHKTILVDIDRSDINFDFVTFNDYKNGVGGFGKEHCTKGIVAANTKWSLLLQAQGNMMHGNRRYFMPINNIGVTYRCRDKHHRLLYEMKKPVALSQIERQLFTSKQVNAKPGLGNNNHIELFWEMGTQKGNMNQKSIFEQNFKGGSYSVNIDIVIREEL
ncbi:hypothetical protein EYV94_19545 [Puteibacter caeruleilacunae]|nr:hypothetical protein EYV94_19545 [Puteibacter caeruleilacunae]